MSKECITYSLDNFKTDLDVQGSDHLSNFRAVLEGHLSTWSTDYPKVAKIITPSLYMVILWIQLKKELKYEPDSEFKRFIFSNLGKLDEIFTPQ